MVSVTVRQGENVERIDDLRSVGYGGVDTLREEGGDFRAQGPSSWNMGESSGTSIRVGTFLRSIPWAWWVLEFPGKSLSQFPVTVAQTSQTYEKALLGSRPSGRKM
jgi:hypothetical protein